MEKHHLFADSAGTQALVMALEKKIIEQNAIILQEIRNWMDQFKNNLPGDIIESGGVKNININYYGSKSHGADEPLPDELPARLTTPQAQRIKEALVSAQLITDSWQPINMSGSERSLLAKAVCDRLGINDVWQMFGQLWSEKPGTLRCYYNRAMEQKKTYVFLEKIKNVLG